MRALLVCCAIVVLFTFHYMCVRSNRQAPLGQPASLGAQSLATGGEFAAADQIPDESQSADDRLWRRALSRHLPISKIVPQKPGTDILSRLIEDPKATKAWLAGENESASSMDSRLVEFPEDIPESDTATVLDAILADVLNNSRLAHSRDFYGNPGDGQLALVDNAHYGVAWPAWYRPTIPNYTITRVREFEGGGLAMPKRIGVRINKFTLRDRQPESTDASPIFDGPISITILNAGGTLNGHYRGGGLTVYYAPYRIRNKWGVRFRGAHS